LGRKYTFIHSVYVLIVLELSTPFHIILSSSPVQLRSFTKSMALDASAKNAAVDIDDKTKDGVKDDAAAGWSSYRRVFAYTDTTGWLLNMVALITAIISGALLPLMNLVFGKTVTTFTNFGTGRISPADFRSQSTSWTLWFIYLFIARFCLTYIWTVAINISALRTTKALRIDFLRQALRQDIAFFDQSSNGALAIQITTNGNLVNVGIAEKLGLGIQGLATFIAAFAVVRIINHSSRVLSSINHS
jgi:ATP-binding cassette subfamily B (MDR/TAP) protein 1